MIQNVDAEKRFKNELKVALKEGRLIVGVKRCLKTLKAKNTNIVAVANNCPAKDALRQAAQECGVELVEFGALNNVEFGELCKKPFRVTAATIANAKTEGV